jgi:hypothetical protein
MNQHVVILGTGPASRGDAPYDDPGVDIWTIGRGSQIPPRISALFELHVPALWDGWGDKEGKLLYTDILKSWSTTDIFMQEAYPDIPRAKRLPKEEILKHVGDNPYQTSQVSWMMSYAMFLGYPEISFYGIDLISEGEARSYQRHCLEYLVGLARGRGHKVNIAKKSSVCKQKIKGENALYAYDYPLTREEAVVVYGHPLRQVVYTKDGDIREVREVPGLLGMPMVAADGKGNDMKVVSTFPENLKAMEQFNRMKDLKNAKTA